MIDWSAIIIASCDYVDEGILFIFDIFVRRNGFNLTVDSFAFDRVAKFFMVGSSKRVSLIE